MIFEDFWRNLRKFSTLLEQGSDLGFEISDLNYQLIHVHVAYMVWTLLASLEATMASKQPPRSDLTSDLK